MITKPAVASGYRHEQVDLVRATSLYVTTKLGDIMDELVIVGGLVPSLIIPQESLAAGVDPHVGTLDLDVGMALAVLDHQRYQELTLRLRRAGFAQDINEENKRTNQRWIIAGPGTASVTVDFLIQPSLPGDRGGRLRNIEQGFAAVITPGLELAFRDREHIHLCGSTIFGERAERDVWVCGPGAFVVLKALAFRSRGENKDAYDLFYCVKNYGRGVDDVCRHLSPLMDSEYAQDAVRILRQDFTAHDSLGPRRVADFVSGGPDADMQADVVGYVDGLLKKLETAAP